ncbi:MAG: signal peptidase II [Candidatus Omnitrophica bacterium]|nr:signal peptidase II [Candidatus Omnitrophota bacterium]
MFRNIVLAVIGVIFLTADQIIKVVLVHSFAPGQSAPVIKNVFHITLVFNKGCAFGLFKNQPALFFPVVSLAAVGFLIYFLRHLRDESIVCRLAAILLIAGSLSNLIDRLRYGYVVDFLDFRVWPVFNLGDTAITIGIFIFIVHLFLRKKLLTTNN